MNPRSILLLSLSACFSPELEGKQFACETDADCAESHICAQVGSKKACITPGADPIRVGQSAALSGPSAALGIEMNRGVAACFKEINDAGGINGRPLVLETRDDRYEAENARQATLELLDIASNPSADTRGPNGVMALLGYVGTPTMIEAAPLAIQTRTIFFGAFTGAQAFLRDGKEFPYLFNLRASYQQETAVMATIIHDELQNLGLANVVSASNIVAMTQADSYGDAGYAAFVEAWRGYEPDLASDGITRVQYTRNTPAEAVTAADETATYIAATEGAQFAVFMIDAYAAGDQYIRRLRDLEAEGRFPDKRLFFIHVSFVQGDALAAQLTTGATTAANGTEYTRDVWVTQVVPYYLSARAGVQAYRSALDAYDGKKIYNYTSLEGYLSCKAFAQGLARAYPDIDGPELYAAFEGMTRFDLDINVPLGFTTTDHQASDTVWVTQIEPAGSFKEHFTWENGTLRQSGN